MNYSFDEAESDAAHKSWGFNCGPAALAFALQKKPDDVRAALVGFEQRRYTNPTMMEAALKTLRVKFHKVFNPSGGKGMTNSRYAMWEGPVSLVRIQFTGPWTADGANYKWASTHTHWVCCWVGDGAHLVFDVNGGIMDAYRWENKIVPAIAATIKRADGGWYAANVWRLT